MFYPIFFKPIFIDRTVFLFLLTRVYRVVMKIVNQKPICRPKDIDPVTFQFLLTKTGVVTYSLF